MNAPLIRCKLLDNELESQQNSTDQSKDFVRQRQIEGFPPFDYLQLGYRLDITGLFLRDTFITLPVNSPGTFNLWVWQIWGDELDATTYGGQGELSLFEPASNEKFAYEDFRSKVG